MSVWDDEWEDYELDKHDFECWLDSINESGDPERDEEFYNKAMEKNPEWVVTTPKYIMSISHN